MSDESVESRVSRLEEAIDQIARVQTGMADSFDKLAREMRGAKTPIGQIAGVVAVVITVIMGVVGAVGSGYVRDQDRLELAVMKMASSLAAHAGSAGHLAMTQRADGMAAAIVELDIVLQREMRLLDASQINQINNLDTGLQREMRLLDNRLEALIERNAENIRRKE